MPDYNIIKIHKDECPIMQFQTVNTQKLEIKYLEFLTDEALKWKSHIKYIDIRNRKTIHKFKTFKNFIMLQNLKLT